MILFEILSKKFYIACALIRLWTLIAQIFQRVDPWHARNMCQPYAAINSLCNGRARIELGRVPPKCAPRIADIICHTKHNYSVLKRILKLLERIWNVTTSAICGFLPELRSNYCVT